MVDRYAFHPGVVLELTGDDRVRRHFAREYGPAATGDQTVATVEASFGHVDERAEGCVEGGHKTMHWRSAVSEPGADPLALRVQVSGLPRGYAMSIVQSYYLEPLLAVAATRAGAVLLPAASFEVEGRATIVVGLSGSGKTSLSMQALALRQPLMGDDQVLVTPDGTCRPFPRCMRLYPDLRERAPLAYRGLSRRDRCGLAARRLARTITGGWLAPSLTLSRASLGEVGLPEPTSVGHVVLLVRSPDRGEVRVDAATTGDAIELCLEALREQRRHLVEGREGWRLALADIERKEARQLGRAFACVPVTRVVVPTPLVGDGLAHLAGQLGLGQRAQPGEIGTWP
jgi:hypothetical protein